MQSDHSEWKAKFHLLVASREYEAQVASTSKETCHVARRSVRRRRHSCGGHCQQAWRVSVSLMACRKHRFSRKAYVSALRDLQGPHTVAHNHKVSTFLSCRSSPSPQSAAHVLIDQAWGLWLTGMTARLDVFQNMFSVIVRTAGLQRCRIP